MMMEEVIRNRIKESIMTKELVLKRDDIVHSVCFITCSLYETLCINHGKVLLCGNGGSASDALHIAGELNGRFQKDRRAFPAIALDADVASLTAIANDYGYDAVFSRMVDGLMNEQDLLIGISTSGNSENIYRAVCKAREKGGKTVALLGKDGGKIKDVVDYSIIIPSDVTARIQECHILIGHIICELVEDMICSKNYGRNDKNEQLR